MAIKLPNVCQINGVTYYRRKMKGQQIYTQLPNPSDPKFAIEYQRAKTGAEIQVISSRREASGPTRGSFAALIREYEASADYAGLSANSKRVCGYYLRIFEERFGSRQVKDMTYAVVERIRDEYLATPGKANALMSWLRILLNMGVRRGYCATNPTVGMKRLKMGEHQPWPQDVITKALEEGDAILRIAIITGLCSGQRLSDCIIMRRDQFDRAGRMPLRQKKTGKVVLIPRHPLWQEEIDAAPAGDTIISTAKGAPTTERAIQSRLSALFKRLGIEGYSFHGLRKNATNYLTECGLTPIEVGVITGMSIEMVQHYTRAISQSRVLDLVEERVKRGAPVVSLHTQGVKSAGQGC